MTEHVAQARGQPFATLELAAQQHHRQIGQHGEGCGDAVERAEVGLRHGGAGHSPHQAEAQAQQQGAGRVADGEADVLHQQVVELVHRGVAVRLMDQLHFPQHEWMAADRALAEDHQVAREDIGTFNGDGDWRRQPHPAEVVVRAEDDALAAVDIHGVGDAGAAAFGEVVLRMADSTEGFRPGRRRWR